MNSRSSLLLLLLLRRPHPSTVSRLASPSVIRAFTTLNDKECQRLRNADVSVSKPTALPSFDGNSHFRDRDWRITNRFRDFELGNFLGDFWMIKYIFSWWQKESRCLFLDREWRVTIRWGFFGNLGDFHRKFHFWVKCMENIWFDFRKNFWREDWMLKFVEYFEEIWCYDVMGIDASKVKIME